uniref:PC4 domain-containing protein n=1 Tax=Macrostomum lignano TaxID=282301 RepID=A0A1I8IVC8_9PLAT
MFYFDVGYNRRGTFLRMSEVRQNFRTAVTLPEKSWQQLRDILTEYIDQVAGNGGGTATVDAVAVADAEEEDDEQVEMFKAKSISKLYEMDSQSKRLIRGVLELAKHPGFIIVKAITPGLSSRDRIVSDRHPSKPTGNEVCIDLTGEGDPWTPAESYFKPGDKDSGASASVQPVGPWWSLNTWLDWYRS